MNEKCRKAIKTGRDSLLNYNLLHKDSNNVRLNVNIQTIPFYNEQHISMNDYHCIQASKKTWITYMML